MSRSRGPGGALAGSGALKAHVTSDAESNRAARSWWPLVRPRLPALAASLLVVAYCIVRYGDCVLTFFFLDDFWLLRDATRLHVQSPVDLGRFFAFNHMGFQLYRPLTQAVYFFVLHRAFGLDSTGYHLVQLGVFCANALLVLAIARRATTSLPCGLCAALLYAATPGHAVAVYWIAAFSMTGTALVVFAMIVWWQRSEGARRAVGCTLLQVVALLCSEHGIVAPLLLLAVSAFSPRRERWRAVRRGIAGPLAIVLVYTAAKLIYLAAARSGPSPYDVHFAPERWTPRIGRYASATLNLLIDSVGNTDFFANGRVGVIVCTVAIIATGCALIGWRRWSVLALGIDVFLIGLLPVLPIGFHEYDFFIGIAALGSALAYVGICTLIGGPRGGRVLAAIATAIVLVVDARTGERAARADEILGLYRRGAQASEVLMQNLATLAKGQFAGSEILVPRDLQTANALELGDAGAVFFSPPLRVRLVPPETTSAGPSQLLLPQPAVPLRDNEPPFWWHPQLEWIRSTLPTVHFWVRDHLGTSDRDADGSTSLGPPS